MNQKNNDTAAILRSILAIGSLTFSTLTLAKLAGDEGTHFVQMLREKSDRTK